MLFDFGIADKNDDPAIRRLLAENPMPGLVSVAFEREPDYFLGHGVMGGKCITVKAVERNSGKLAGIVCLASADRFINGVVQAVGYVGQVRVDRSFQGTMLPLRTFPYIRSLVEGDWPNLWFGVIVNDNPEAHALFVGLPRPSFPAAEVVSPIHTLALLTRRHSAGRRSGSISIRRGNEIGWDKIVTFLNEQGAHREFAPHYTVEHLAGESRTPGLRDRDFVVAETAGKIAGVCALWDQSGFKQTVVHNYGGWLAGTRPLINCAGRLIGLKKLPDIGDPVKSATLSFIAVRDDNPAVFRRLLNTALVDAGRRGKDYLMAGFSLRDPLLKVAGGYRHILYRSTMYAFSFDQSPDSKSFNRDNIPHLEVAAL